MSLLYTPVGAIEPKTLNSYITHNILSGVRIDTSRSLGNKSLLHIRPTKYDVSALVGTCVTTDAGACIPIVTARRGGTVVSCGIKAEITVCSPEHPSEGRLYVEASCPLVGSSIPSVQKQQDCSSLAAFVTDVLSGTVDKHKLVIREGEACWLLYIDLVVVSVDGSLRDVGCAAAAKALQMIKLPKSRLPDGTLSESVADIFHSFPLAVSFLVVPYPTLVGQSHAQYLVADPCTAEESLAIHGYSAKRIDTTKDNSSIEYHDNGLEISIPAVACVVTIVINTWNSSEVLRVLHHGGTGVSLNNMKEMVTVAANYCNEGGS